MTPRKAIPKVGSKACGAKESGCMTINDIARLAKVSKKTVSRVINDFQYVRASTREAVEAVIRLHRYVPESQARGLAFRRSFLIGMIYDNPNPQYVVDVQQGILDGLRHTGFELVLRPVDHTKPTYLSDVRAFVTRQKLSGVILLPSMSEDEKLVHLLADMNCSYVRVASVLLDEAARMVVTHDRLGGAAAGRRLAELGHRHIAHVSGPAWFRSTHERRRGFVAGLAEAGLELAPELSKEGAYTYESGLAHGLELLSAKVRPTAIFTGNDEMALGVYRAAHQLGLRIPQDLSVIGYDDAPVAARVWPPLTSVRLPVRDMGRAAVEGLFAQRDTRPARVFEFKPVLVERESTAPIKDFERPAVRQRKMAFLSNTAAPKRLDKKRGRVLCDSGDRD